MKYYIRPENLGSEAFKQDYGIRYAYVAGAMVKGIASKELVIRMGQAGFLAFFGTGGLNLLVIEKNIQSIQEALSKGGAYGMNLLCNLAKPEKELETVDLFLRYGIRNVEASAFMQITPALVKFRLAGLWQDVSGQLVAQTRLMAKISRPEVAELFLSPPPSALVEGLLLQGQISEEAAALSQYLPLASDLCVEADSGGHTDMGNAAVLIPAMLRLREQLQSRYRYQQAVRIGAGGGIGTPEAAASAFVLGADFILTGSINQCTVEAGTSEAVKDMLQELNVQDTDYAPAGDMFELGAKIQVMRKSVFFPARANKLYDLWRTHEALEAIDPATRLQIQEKFFGCSFEAVYQETQAYYLRESPAEIGRAEQYPKAKMALVFRWYFIHTMRLAAAGVLSQRVNFQVHCGPALGVFNQWVKGTHLQDWRDRHVEQIAMQLMEATADFLRQRLQVWL
ncbi:MAG: PfaD family polyunsaturated fatty acid/polyketide biosynthesis protein [Methylovulum sp.]|nr:PfaD family polyunsaturated fatty acid/polyketide biosynthesis protein [Methylovulum sp.]